MDPLTILAKAREIYRTDTALADALGIDRRTLNNWRTERTQISRLAQLALLQLIAQHEAKP